MTTRTVSRADLEIAARLVCEHEGALPEARRRRILRRLFEDRPDSRRARRRLKQIIVAYREETGAVGAIDWAKIHEWFKEHLAEIKFAQLVLSILMLMLMFI